MKKTMTCAQGRRFHSTLQITAIQHSITCSAFTFYKKYFNFLHVSQKIKTALKKLRLQSNDYNYWESVSSFKGKSSKNDNMFSQFSDKISPSHHHLNYKFYTTGIFTPNNIAEEAFLKKEGLFSLKYFFRCISTANLSFSLILKQLSLFSTKS